MPEADGEVVISNTTSGLSALEPFSQHFFVGSNKTILNILRENIDELGITASTTQFQATIARLMELLQNATSSIEINRSELDGDMLTLDLAIEQFVGHKFPTGFPSRRAWIHMTVTDASGNIVFESGKPNEDGSITGCDADKDANSYEPHYDVISQPDQVQIYEAIMQDFEGNITYTLLRAADFAKDNRLLPLGFDIENAVDNIAIHGSAAIDENFIGGSDQIVYQIDTQDYSSPFTIQVELLMQTISYRFIQDFYSDDNSLADDFIALYQDTDKMPALITTISLNIS